MIAWLHIPIYTKAEAVLHCSFFSAVILSCKTHQTKKQQPDMPFKGSNFIIALAAPPSPPLTYNIRLLSALQDKGAADVTLKGKQASLMWALCGWVGSSIADKVLFFITAKHVTSEASASRQLGSTPSTQPSDIRKVRVRDVLIFSN